jgi:hypothetical protein
MSHQARVPLPTHLDEAGLAFGYRRAPTELVALLLTALAHGDQQLVGKAARVEVPAVDLGRAERRAPTRAIATSVRVHGRLDWFAAEVLPAARLIESQLHDRS